MLIDNIKQYKQYYNEDKLSFGEISVGIKLGNTLTGS